MSQMSEDSMRAIAAGRIEEPKAYYVLTTMDREISLIFPQAWTRGKLLYVVIRYGFVVSICLLLSTNYRNQLVLDPVVSASPFRSTDERSDSSRIARHWPSRQVSLGFLSFLHAKLFPPLKSRVVAELALCLSALNQSKGLYTLGLLTICLSVPCIDIVFSTIANVQYPHQWDHITSLYTGRTLRFFLGVFTVTWLMVEPIKIFFRYRGNRGRLLQIMRRDGGLYSISLIGWPVLRRRESTHERYLSNYQIAPPETYPASTLYNVIGDILVPILAQRLMVNIRQVDSMGSQPFASKLLFAPPEPGSEDLVGGASEHTVRQARR
ncbi:hypothetical protein FA13DRAFT_1711663 [Coprinellus micaceus]|uniref:Uncharacterized protein n=1 Tax=Coprinellus micaceus TaxID=71717 RepID=A0A4Y7T3D6_COPMI|nr:hypothetical protein FA13DRAFT_1711663 [Coprinellus micaceus]